ncbi:MAG: polyphenol oxidase family protein [Phycisphaerae bacterium]|jgi:YfiH family protein
MHVLTVAGRRYAQWPHMREQPGLCHAFSTRPENLSPRSGPDEEERAARRGQMTADWGLSADRLHHCQQVHETRIALVTEAGPAAELTGCDAVVTTVPRLPLMAFSADCPLLLVYDPRRRALGLVHASWRCTVGQLVRRLVELLVTRCGSVPSDLLAAIGPGAGPCCYEVQDDVYAAAVDLPQRNELFRRREGRMFFDLWRANHALLCEAGVRADNIEAAGVCTMCRNDLFFSYRREGRGCSHFALLAALREEPADDGECVP